MPAVLSPLVAPFVDRRTTLRRWAFLLLGAMVLLPFSVIGLPLAQLVHDQLIPAVPVPVSFPIGCLLVLTVVSLIPAIRGLEVIAVREALGVELPPESAAPPRSWPVRWRGTGWFLLHLVAGGTVGTLTVQLVPLAAAFVAATFTGGRVPTPTGETAWTVPAAAAPVIAAGTLVGLVYLVAVLGALLTRAAPVLLGPSRGDRLAAAERRAEQLAERNRLARELHDSVGHALSVVTLQAGAAGRLLDTDPAFARSALAAIEESGRRALEDLDHVLGLLREDGAGTAVQRTLADLDALLSTAAAGGARVDCVVAGELADVPAVVSREAYRIVQEGVTNALRHAGAVPVTVRVTVAPDELDLEITNPLGTAPDGARRRAGGLGLRGIAERVTVLRGQLSAEAEDGCWRLRARLPLRPGASTR